MEAIRIALVDDHTLFRNGLAALLKEFAEVEVIFQASSGLEMQQLIGHPLVPDVVLMDINMAGLDGYSATAWLKVQYPTVKILAISMFAEEKAVIRMLQAGASGYVLKESNPSEVLEAVRTIHEKGYFLNDMVSGILVRSVKPKADSPQFSAKELEFIKLCCSEMTYKEIADQLFVSPRTVDNYRESVFEKLHLKSRTGIVLYAIQYDLFRI